MKKEKMIRVLGLFAADFIIILLSYLFVCFFSPYDGRSPAEAKIFEGIFLVISYTLFFFVFKVYDRIWQVAGTREFLVGVFSCFCAALVSVPVLIFYFGTSVYTSVVLTFLCSINTLSIRLFIRIENNARMILRSKYIKSGKRTLVIGAGAGATGLIREMRRNPEKYNPIAVVDDDPAKYHTYIRGVKVCGNRNDIIRLVNELNIELIVFAIAAISSSDKRKILEICSECNVPVEVLPSVYQLVNQEKFLSQIRPINITDLLGRDEITLDYGEISTYLSGKKIMVTGGGGSIGSELCRQIAAFNPKCLIILDIYENNAYEIQTQLTRKYPELPLKIYIASVRDEKRLETIFETERPDVVFHAAAHKHVPLMEANPTEAIKNNILGTLNTAVCADKFNVSRFVLISTDKAVNPTNIMGATKRVCEMIIQGIDRKSQTEYVAVRFGNVLGSNGSVIPLFQKQIEAGGPVTVTHKEITRFFMSIPEAAQLVIQAGAFARGGEIFVLDMGNPVKIYKLAEEVIRTCGLEPHKDIKIDIIGLRPGEKLYEELLMSEEGLKKTAHNLIFVAKPMFVDFDALKNDISELVFLADEGKEAEAVDKLAEIVPTYRKVSNPCIKKC
ncbi:MAG: polysaccharide biosynthesis protein [Clostridia bacterium]|nr:polysaccharide biosynthesis protein [Clostridia bacterium]